jgi:hypothetical protein
VCRSRRTNHEMWFSRESCRRMRSLRLLASFICSTLFCLDHKAIGVTHHSQSRFNNYTKRDSRDQKLATAALTIDSAQKQHFPQTMRKF